MLGSDGAVYITQNGGTVGAWKAEVMSTPSIQKAWPDGRVEIIVKEVAGHKLQAPNDLSFGPDGRLFLQIRVITTQTIEALGAFLPSIQMVRASCWMRFRPRIPMELLLRRKAPLSGLNLTNAGSID